jgi:hypothetical protein
MLPPPAIAGAVDGVGLRWLGGCTGAFAPHWSQ